jgi:hypothetical protein
MKDQKKKTENDSQYSYAFDSKDTTVEDNIYSPFKIGKTTISKLISTYLSKTFTEDIDYIQQRGGNINII